MKGVANRRTVPLLFSLFTLFSLSFCHNPWMYQILDPRTIFFDSNGGSSVDSQMVMKDYKIIRPSTPSRRGYIFGEWYIDNGIFENPWDFNSMIPTSDMTLYAGWIEGYIDGFPVRNVFDVRNAAQWNTAVSTINERGTGDYLIEVNASFSMNGVTADTFSATDINVTISGSYTISLTGTGSLLRAGSTQNITMRNLTLRGNAGNNASLVNVDSGTFIMEGSAKITGNTATSSAGVYVSNGGEFTMKGGTVSGNTATMGSGGGVNVSFSTFRISNGIVYGNDGNDDSLKNTATSNAALCTTGPGGTSTMEHGTFINGTWNSLGTLTDTSNTIRVVNGVLQ